MVKSITILPGSNRQGNPEFKESIELKMGNVISIVGPTGSGKTTLINDIELLSDGTTPTGRRILINNALPPADYRNNPSRNPIALITQHTTFLSDLPVHEFLFMHARIRNKNDQHVSELIQKTIDFANQLTGEPIITNSKMTELSGGQTRALLIADAAVICDTPVVLLDEVENAGIHRTRALELLRRHEKIFVFVTHDPRIALLSDFRVIMKEGGIAQVLYTNHVERDFAERVTKLDDVLGSLREIIRKGERLTTEALEGVL
ncbi:MAG: ATP-binding cassette domain-containing protein [Clostridiaceae bacterium]|jgi:ABC-type lipoprotein export system ATPase subunit|nr:ATP-binding cassette domain-containing protein [Clostridiaceae bacterium]